MFHIHSFTPKFVIFACVLFLYPPSSYTVTASTHSNSGFSIKPESVSDTEISIESESVSDTEISIESESISDTEISIGSESVSDTEISIGSESVSDTEISEENFITPDTEILENDEISSFSVDAKTIESTEMVSEKHSAAPASSLFANIQDDSFTDGYYIKKIYSSDITSEKKTYTVIQRALNEAALYATDSSPYKIVIEPGNYTLTKSLHIYSNTCLYMEGVTFTQLSSVKSNMLKIGDTADTQTGYYYKNITIDGGEVGGTFNENGNSNTAIKAAHINNFLMHGITLCNTIDSHLMEIAGVNGFSLSDCHFKDQTVKSRQYLEAIQIDFLIPSHFSGYIYEVLANQNISVYNCTFSDVPRGIGSHTSILNLPINNLTIANNTFSNLKSAAIQLQNCINCTISDNTITNCPRGITIYNTRNYGEGNFLASTIANAGGIATTISSDYIKPSQDQNITIKNNSISCTGDDTFNPGYERTCIFLAGYSCSAPTSPVSGDILPAGDYYVSGVSICNNTISTSQYGIILQNTKNSTILSNVISFNSNHSQFGIHLRSNSTKNIIKKNIITGCNGNSIFINSNSSCQSLSNNRIKNSGFCDICVKDSTIKSINSNTLTASGAYSIYLESAKVTTIKGNKIHSANSYGIAVSNGKAEKIYENTIRSSGNHSIVIFNNAFVSRIFKNRISSGNGYGINIGSIRSNLKISSNTLKNCHDIQLYINPETLSKKIAITQNTLSGTSSEFGVFINSGRVSISKNTLKNFLVPVQIAGSAKCTIKTNTLKKNAINKIRIVDSGLSNSDQQYKVPGKPTSLKASSIGSSKITLTWKKSPNADGYYIYRSTSKNGTYKKIANITKSKGTTYTDKKLKKNKKYYYKLVSYKKTSNKNTVFLSPNSKILPQRTKH